MKKVEIDIENNCIYVIDESEKNKVKRTTYSSSDKDLFIQNEENNQEYIDCIEWENNG